MRSSWKGILTWKNLAIAGGGALVALALIDTVVQSKSAGFGHGARSQIAGETIFAFLLVGIIVGMVLGIVLAFSYFMWKEKKLLENPDQLTLLLEELAKEEVLFTEDSAFEAEDKEDALEPWERPTDWWKSEED